MGDFNLDWYDSYEYSEKQRLLIPGIYDFTVSDIQKCWHEGSAKIPPCNALHMWISIDGEDVTLYEKFFLISTMVWKIDKFLKCIGFEEQNVSLLLRSRGKGGMCHVCTRELEQGTINNIDRFITQNDDIEWIKLRDFIFERDGYKCRICGKTKDLRIHHTIEKSADSSNMYNPNNLQVLCEECHEKAHSRHVFYGGPF